MESDHKYKQAFEDALAPIRAEIEQLGGRAMSSESTVVIDFADIDFKRKLYLIGNEWHYLGPTRPKVQSPIRWNTAGEPSDLVSRMWEDMKIDLKVLVSLGEIELIEGKYVATNQRHS